jgi:hypothetical protein
MERRSFLRALCFAPIAIPVAAKIAAAKPEKTSFTITADRFVVHDGPPPIAKYTLVPGPDGVWYVGLAHAPGEFDKMVADAARRNKARRIS